MTEGTAMAPWNGPKYQHTQHYVQSVQNMMQIHSQNNTAG